MYAISEPNHPRQPEELVTRGKWPGLLKGVVVHLGHSGMCFAQWCSRHTRVFWDRVWYHEERKGRRGEGDLAICSRLAGGSGPVEDE